MTPPLDSPDTSRPPRRHRRLVAAAAAGLAITAAAAGHPAAAGAAPREAAALDAVDTYTGLAFTVPAGKDDLGQPQT